MQCHRHLISRNPADVLRVINGFRSLSPVFSSHLSGVRHIQPSPVRLSSTSTESLGRTIQIAEPPLLASASGGTPTPEEPEDGDKHGSTNETDQSTNRSKPPNSDSFAHNSGRPRGRPRGTSSRRNILPPRVRRTTALNREIPKWFLSRNVVLSDNLSQIVRREPLASSLPVSGDTPTKSKEESTNEINRCLRHVIELSPYIYRELAAHLSAGLLVQSGTFRENRLSQKAHVFLRCPERGALYFLDEIVEEAARELNADIVTLDIQDLNELLEDFVDLPPAEMGLSPPQIVFTNIFRGISPGKEDDPKEESVAEDEHEDMGNDDVSDDPNHFQLSADIPLRLFRLFGNRPMDSPILNPNGSQFSSLSPYRVPRENMDSKLAFYVDALISSPGTKRNRTLATTPPKECEASMSRASAASARTIIYLRDFPAVIDNPLGQMAHQILINAINDRRRLGEKIVLIVSDNGSTSGVTSMPLLKSHYHFIKIPAPVSEPGRSALRDGRRARTREINLRNLQFAIRHRIHAPSMNFDWPVGIHLDAQATSCLPGIENGVWDMDKVQRIASIAIGNHGKWLAQHTQSRVVPLTISDIARATEHAMQADQERTAKRSQKDSKSQVASAESQPEALEIKQDSLKFTPITSKDCNKHEQKLLSGVIDPGG
jgi:hypothetical protein